MDAVALCFFIAVAIGAIIGWLLGGRSAAASKQVDPIFVCSLTKWSRSGMPIAMPPRACRDPGLLRMSASEVSRHESQELVEAKEALGAVRRDQQ